MHVRRGGLGQPSEQVPFDGVLKRRSQRFPGVFEIDPGYGDRAALQGDGGIDELDAIENLLIDEHDHPRRWLGSQDQRQHAFGQARGPSSAVASTSGEELRRMRLTSAYAGTSFLASLKLFSK